MNYIKFLPYNSFNIAVRDKREVGAVLELGYCVTIVSSDKSLKSNSGFDSCELINDGCSVPQGMPRLKRYRVMVGDRLRLVRRICETKCDAISCHDLLALWLGYLIKRKHKNGKNIRLIYDSHEFEIGRNAKRSKLHRWGVKAKERFLAKRSDMIIIPCDGAADELQRIYKLKKRPVVIKSVPEKWSITLSDTLAARASVRELLGISKDSFMILYHGNVFPNRGIENMIAVLKEVPEITGMILGNAVNQSYIDSLKSYASNLGVADRLIFHEAVPYIDLWKYIGASDVGMVIVPASCKSHYFMLPNKFFENIHAFNPIICSNLPEVSRIVNKYDIGLIVDPNDVKDISMAVKKMKDDEYLYQKFKENTQKAKEDLDWNIEKRILKEQIKMMESNDK